MWFKVHSEITKKRCINARREFSVETCPAKRTLSGKQTWAESVKLFANRHEANSWLYLMNASSYLWDVTVQYRYRDIMLYTLLVFPCCTYNVNHFGLVSNGRIACVDACLGSCKHAIPRCKSWKSTRILLCIIASCHRICMKSTVYIMSLYQHVYPVNF